MVLNFCRMCLKSVETLVPEDDEVHQQIEEIFKFKIAERQDFPQKVCSLCSKIVTEFYTFYENVRDNQVKLEEMGIEKLDLSFELKEEVDEDEPDKNLDILLEISENNDSQSDSDDKDHDIDVTSPKKRGRKNKLDCNKKKPNSQRKRVEDPEKLKEEDEKISKYFNFKCIMCPQEPITNLKEWLSHQRRVHGEKNPALICCDRKLRSRVRMLSHIHYHHELEPMFECPNSNCSKKFKRKAHLDGHLRSHGIQQIKKFQCDKCDEKFTYKSHLDKHQIILHMTPEERKAVQLFGCDQCDKTFARQHQLLTHKRRIHQRRYTFICHICAKKFNKKERLDAHMLDKHTDNPPKHQCEVCGLEMPTHEAYRRHLRFYHAEQGDFVCDVCGATRKNEMSLKQHKRYVHETERKFACKYCSKAFRRALELTEHLTTHLGGTLYSCPYCERKFNSKANMQSKSKHKCTLLYKDLSVNSITTNVDPNKYYVN